MDAVWVGLVLCDYLSEGPYRFQMQFEKGTFKDFYSPRSDNAQILEERRNLLRTRRSKHFALLPEAGSLLQEFEEMVEATIGITVAADELNAKAIYLGENLEPDFLLLLPDGKNVKLVAGVVCFPSSWSLEEKIGRPIQEIHAVVPGLNSNLGNPIQNFLLKLKGGFSWNRTNWGLSRSGDRNQHPALGMKSMDEEIELKEIFFRVEEQSLVLMPKSGGIIFGIRLKIIPLSDFKSEEVARLRLINALQTMPDDMARYKGLGSSRNRILTLLK
jgi:hypothetical protein